MGIAFIRSPGKINYYSIPAHSLKQTLQIKLELYPEIERLDVQVYTIQSIERYT